MNTVSIAGKVLEEPIKSTSSSGVSIAKIKIGVDKNSKDNDANGYDVFEIVVFRELAEQKYELGQTLGIVGKVSANNYEKEGKAYYNCSIIGNSITVLS